MRRILVTLLVLGSILLPAATTQANVPAPAAPHHRSVQVGRASFYHSDFDGKTTASGATFDSQLLTAAHRTLQFGTRVRVTNLVNLRSVIVTINDRGPFVSGRIIDLSHHAAAMLGFVQDGVTRVKVEPLTVASAL
jgi:rare lipoprotein A